MGLLREMGELADAFSYNAAIEAAKRDENWSQCIELFEEMKAAEKIQLVSHKLVERLRVYLK